MNKKSLLRGAELSPAFILILLACAALVFFAADAAAATQKDIPGPPGSQTFGKSISVLPNGNIVVTDPYYDAPGPIVDVGAVYLYNSAGVLLSTLTGAAPDDRIGLRWGNGFAERQLRRAE